MDCIALGVGILIGIAICGIILILRKRDGLLRVHWDEDEGKPYLFLELDDVPEKLIKRRVVVFRVKEDARQ
jgi:hypothetical protein